MKGDVPKFTRGRVIAVVLASGLLGWGMTRALLGLAAPPEPVFGGRTEIVDHFPPPAPGAVEQVSLQRAHMGDMTATVEGHDVLITGDATVTDRMGESHVWTVQVRAGDFRGPLVEQRHYTEGARTLPQGEETRLAFADAIELPAGAYNIRLHLYAVPRDFRWDRLGPADDPKSLGATHVGGSRNIIIPGPEGRP